MHLMHVCNTRDVTLKDDSDIQRADPIFDSIPTGDQNWDPNLTKTLAHIRQTNTLFKYLKTDIFFISFITTGLQIVILDSRSSAETSPI